MGLGTQLADFGVEKAKERPRAMRKEADELREKLMTVREGRVDAATAAFEATQEATNIQVDL